MKRENLEQYIIDNELLQSMPYGKAGIYAITIDFYGKHRVVYVGETTNLYERGAEHIYNTQNAMYLDESKNKKYYLLLSAQLSGFKVDVEKITECNRYELRELEDNWIEYYDPPLNVLTPMGRRDISNYSLLDVIMNSIDFKKQK